jgi:nucleolar GTP-binding protein
MLNAALFAEAAILKRQKQGMEVDEDEGVEQQAKKKKLEKDLELELGDDYYLDLKKWYDLPAEYRWDNIPEILNGKNIADFIDPEIEKVLAHFQGK